MGSVGLGTAQSDLFHADHADQHVSTMNTDVNVIQGEGELDVKICKIFVFVCIDLALLVCKLNAQKVKEQAEMLSFPD